jgi:HSP20 family protein
MSKQHRLLSELSAIEQQLMQLVKGPNLFTVDQHRPAAWSPAVDIYETAASFVLTAEVPGVKSSEIDIKVVDHNLILRGERRWERDVHGENVHRLENSYGKFERSFTLSETIDAEKISAQLQRGVLRVELPKREQAGRQIQIQME